MKRVLITGGSGFLGARILQQGLGDAELCSLPSGFLAAAGEAEVTETIQKLQPAAIVHAAALSDTGYCAQHPEEAHRANVELPVWVAKSCLRIRRKAAGVQFRSGLCRNHAARAAAGDIASAADQCIWPLQTGNGTARAGTLPGRCAAAGQLDV